MKSLVLMVLVFLGAWYVAGIDQHARHATVWASDGRVWHDSTMDRNFAGEWNAIFWIQKTQNRGV